MGIKNYSTTVSAIKTVGEIQAILGKATAKSVSVDYEEGQPVAIRFSLLVAAQEVWFRLPCNVEGVLRTMQRDRVEKRYRNIEQARRAPWRIIKDWIDAQMAIIDAGQVKAAEVFFPYILQSDGQTLFQYYENQQLALGEGKR